MVPETSSPPVDLRAQVIENCEFFSGTLARISLVAAKEPLGTYRAIVLKTENGIREVVFAETAPTYYDALQALHVKSAEAVQNYINSNGFGLVTSIKKQNSKASRFDDSHESDSSTVTLDDCESLSDNETVSVTSVGRTKRNRRKADRAAKTNSTRHKTRQGRTRSRSPSFSTTRARSRSTGSSSSDYELHYDPPVFPANRPPWLNTLPQRMPPRPPQNTFSTFPTGAPPPPPPPPPSGHQGHPQSRFAPSMAMPPPPPPASFSFTNKPPSNPPMPPTVINIPPTSPQTNHNNNNPPTQHHHNPNTSPNPNPNSTPPLQHTHDVILHIRWRHHGERHILEQIPTTPTTPSSNTSISAHALQQAALSFIRRQPASFTSYQQQQQQQHARPPPQWRLAGLAAQVKAVVVDGVVYDLGRWAGDDLGRVVAGVRGAAAAVVGAATGGAAGGATGAATGAMVGGAGVAGAGAGAMTGVGSGSGSGMEGMLRFEVEVWNEGPLVGAGALASARPGVGPSCVLLPGGGGGGSPRGAGGFGPGQRIGYPSLSPGLLAQTHG